jgi:uncharacterized protein (TIGR02246 family)
MSGGQVTARFAIKPAWAAIMLLVTLAGTAGAQAQVQSAPAAADVAAIRNTLASYETALNASDTAAVMPLYTDDGVFMAPYSQSAVGKAAVRQAYDAVFKAITLHVKFTVGEIVEMSPEWAFARTNSAGTNTVNATGAKSAEANQELFIFRKGLDGAWKIARYSFSTTNPALKE